MAKGIFATAFFLMFFSFTKGYCQEEEWIHIRNTVEIDRTNCNGLSRLIVMLPYIQTNEYQTVSNFQPYSGELLVISGTDEKYLRYDVNESTLADSGNIFQIFNEFDILLHPVVFDFLKVNEVYPYNTASEIYMRYTGKSGEYVDPGNLLIQRIGDSLWANASDIIEYSRMCYEYVAANYEYLNPGTGLYILQEILDARGGDCGNLSSIFVSLLRNKNIPARHVVTFRPDGNYHVFADFYLENYGWVPVDVTYKQAYPDGDFFGIYDGLGIVAHTGIWFQFERTEGDSYDYPLLQNFHWWYWLSGECDEIIPVHKVNVSEVIENPTCIIIKQESLLNFFPNPASQQIFLNGFNSVPREIYLTNITGGITRSILFNIDNKYNISFDVSGLASGIYITTIITDEQKADVKRFIKK